MRIGVFINTPGGVHFCKNIVNGLEKRGHDIILFARDYGETIQLLNEFELKYFVYSKPGKSKYSKIMDVPFALFKATCQLLRCPPDLILGFGIYGVFSSIFLRKPCIVFGDSEPRINLLQSIHYKMFMPFVNTIITPTFFLDDLGPKQVKINSCKELAYLHPDYFRPNEEIFDLLQLKRDENYALIRFNDFDGTHDFGIRGFKLRDKIELVKLLSEYTKIFISFEGDAPKEIERYKLTIPKSMIHDVLYYAQLFVTDTQTMSMEAAILGTPVIRSNSFVGNKDMGGLIEFEKKYGLIFNIKDPKIAIRKAEELIQKPNLKKEWRDKREILLEDKCDITKFMVRFIENYPQTFKENKECARYI